VTWLPYVALGALALALLATGLIAGSKVSLSGMMAVDNYAVFFKIIATVAVALVVLSSVDYMRGRRHAGEFYAFLLFATVAITVAAAATNLVMIYLALEFLSLTSAVLVCYRLDDPKSTEAALKYFFVRRGGQRGAALRHVADLWRHRLHGPVGDRQGGGHAD